MRYFLSLGSNLGDRRENLARAARLLRERGVSVVRASSVYRTEPVDLRAQPWFYNQVLEVEAAHNPLALLDLVKAVEGKMKRAPSVPKGPRTIDIDILLAGRTVVQTRSLMIPHPRMARRNFVLVPLSEIAPDVIHPLLLERVEDLAKRSKDTAAVRKVRSRALAPRPAKAVSGPKDSGAGPRVH